MATLREELIRLSHAHPEIQPHVRAVLAALQDPVSVMEQAAQKLGLHRIMKMKPYTVRDWGIDYKGSGRLRNGADITVSILYDKRDQTFNLSVTSEDAYISRVLEFEHDINRIIQEIQVGIDEVMAY